MLLTAEFVETEAVSKAVTSLTAEGFSGDEIELFSDVPVQLPPGVLDRRSRISLMAVLGAVVNASLATAFIYFTQHNYPLVTGGMPIFTGWSIGIVTGEMVGAGAVAGTILMLLWEGGLLIPRKRSGPPPALKPGSVFVQVSCPDGRSVRAAGCLTKAGAVDIQEHREGR
jgi:hypothetical protein